MWQRGWTDLCVAHKVSDCFSFTSCDETLHMMNIGIRRYSCAVWISPGDFACKLILTLWKYMCIKKRSFQQDSAHFKESHYSVRCRAHEWQSVVSAVHKDGSHSLCCWVYTVPSEAKQNQFFTSTFTKRSENGERVWLQNLWSAGY